MIVRLEQGTTPAEVQRLRARLEREGLRTTLSPESRRPIFTVVDKVPGFGDVPILGALFRSVRYQKKETELVLIVTPRLVKPLPAGEFRLPTDSFVEPSDFEFYLLGAMEAQREGDSDGTQSAGLVGPSGHRLPVAMEENAR